MDRRRPRRPPADPAPDRPAAQHDAGRKPPSLLEPVIACPYEEVCPFPTACCPFKCRCEASRYTYLQDSVHLVFDDTPLAVRVDDVGGPPDDGDGDGTRDDVTATVPLYSGPHGDYTVHEVGAACGRCTPTELRGDDAEAPAKDYHLDCTACDDSDEEYCAIHFDPAHFDWWRDCGG